MPGKVIVKVRLIGELEHTAFIKAGARILLLGLWHQFSLIFHLGTDVSWLSEREDVTRAMIAAKVKPDGAVKYLLLH